MTVGALLTRLAAAIPDREALVYAGQPRLTFGELEREARLVARGLMALWRPARRARRRLGDERARVDRAAVRARKVGAILVTANTSLLAHDIDYLVRQSGAATLMTIGGFRGVDYVAALEQIGARAGDLPGVAAGSPCLASLGATRGHA